MADLNRRLNQAEEDITGPGKRNRFGGLDYCIDIVYHKTEVDYATGERREKIISATYDPPNWDAIVPERNGDRRCIRYPRKGEPSPAQPLDDPALAKDKSMENGSSNPGTIAKPATGADS